MVKRKNNWSESKIKRYIKEGRGQGELSEYIPWVKIQDFSSNGNVTRYWGYKTRRQHEFLSNIERDYFLLLEREDNVYDIREQYPLDRSMTVKIAEEKKINHSIDNQTEVYIPMTTDFLITLKVNNQLTYLARTVKPALELEDARVIQKFEIEREYWERKGIDWGIVTEKDITKNMALNIAWANKYYYLDDLEEKSYAKLLLELFKNSKENINLQMICDQFDKDYNLEIGSALTYLRHFIARKIINLNLEERIIVAKLTLNDIEIYELEEGEIDYISS